MAFNFRGVMSRKKSAFPLYDGWINSDKSGLNYQGNRMIFNNNLKEFFYIAVLKCVHLVPSGQEGLNYWFFKFDLAILPRTARCHQELVHIHLKLAYEHWTVARSMYECSNYQEKEVKIKDIDGKLKNIEIMENKNSF